MNILKLCGIVIVVGSFIFGVTMYMQAENFNPEEYSIYSGGNGTFDTVDQEGGMSVYIQSDLMSCGESDVEIFRPSNSEEAFFRGTSYFNADCDDSWDVPGYTYIGLLADAFAYGEPKLTSGEKLTVETNVDIVVADHSAEDDAFGKISIAIPGIIIGFVLIGVGSDEPNNDGASGASAFTQPHVDNRGMQTGSQFTMPSNDQFGTAAESGNIGMNPTAGQQHMGMDYNDQFR